MNTDDPTQWHPPWHLLPLELRAFGEYCFKPRISQPRWPCGDKLPVLVVPGFGQTERSSQALRNMLKVHDFQPADWTLGRNTGMKPGMANALLQRLEQLKTQSGQTPAVVGWSLGGVFARELARKRPDLVSRVVTLGSPIAGGYSTSLQPLFGLLNPKLRHAGKHDPERYKPPSVPCTAIFSRQDGIVNWRASREPQTALTENIEVKGSHMGLGFNPAVWAIICHRLSPHTRDSVYSP